jgi:hypothetical protein
MDASDLTSKKRRIILYTSTNVSKIPEQQSNQMRIDYNLGAQICNIPTSLKFPTLKVGIKCT